MKVIRTVFAFLPLAYLHLIDSSLIEEPEEKKCNVKLHALVAETQASVRVLQEDSAKLHVSLQKINAAEKSPDVVLLFKQFSCAYVLKLIKLIEIYQKMCFLISETTKSVLDIKYNKKIGRTCFEDKLGELRLHYANEDVALGYQKEKFDFMLNRIIKYYKQQDTQGTATINQAGEINAGSDTFQPNPIVEGIHSTIYSAAQTVYQDQTGLITLMESIPAAIKECQNEVNRSMQEDPIIG